ncbi:hypothetical protein [Methylobacterium isbiliense]|jgi:hypothetical protein|uniref:Uncharacterized protein n=1 Tax=Methylobacterium isbiliense TaxID=315478 RepID=A0ABQ4SIQ3_9HYPH|nr:hypothetical protein [Methylobacterium isbiliense]MDN3623650.1 hypothetical protein [Methylobacterium isbiliense]GJE03074.1 hypothetical protein GMJLKIPL_5025 [Methylobacterium isbiliense]
MIRTRSITDPGRRSQTVSVGLLVTVGGLAALLAGLTLAPDQAISSPAPSAGMNRAESRAPASTPASAPAAASQRTSGDEPRRAVRVVYSGPITR